MKLHQLIRQYRKEQNLTQEQLANYLGVSAPAVNKWENGNSYPDITLLAPLARILKTDVNTLLSFREELSQDEINQMILELNGCLMQTGYEQGFQKGESIIRSYPTCDTLVFSVASLLYGYLGILGVKERTPYENKIIAWYELLVTSSDMKVGEMSAASLCNLYIQRDDYEEAQALLDSIPSLGFDKRTMEADLRIKQKEYDAAHTIYEQMLYETANKTYSIVLSILQLVCIQKDYATASSYAALAKAIATQFELGNYMIFSPEFLLAAQQKDADRTLFALDQLLNSSNDVYPTSPNSLYSHMQTKESSNIPMSQMMKTMLQTDHDIDFLREDPRFQALLKKLD